MSEGDKTTGRVVWTDLTVEDAETVRDFYRAVVGWDAEAVDMGGYADFNMMPPGAKAPSAGICHARGSNKDLPPVWMVYIQVEDVEVSVAACREGGGEVIREPAGPGSGGFAVIRDPAGAVCALYEPPPEE